MHGTTSGALRRWAAWGALVTMAALPAGCDRGGQPGSVTAEALPPVPAPAGLVTELTIAHPNATWGRVRDMIGGPMKFMPAGYPMLVASVLGLPPLVAEQIDADVPTVGAVVADASGEIPVAAIHVKSGPLLLKLLTDSPDARFLAKPDAPSRVTILEQRPGQTALGPVLGITGNYLLVGYAPDGLLRVGPYAARTLGARPAPAEDVLLSSDHDALAGPLRTRLSTWWGETRTALERSDQQMRAQHGGSAPTFGDPKAALQKADTTFQGIFALMADLSRGRMALTIDDAGAHLVTTLSPQAPDGLAAREFGAMTVGDGAALLDLPASASIAVLSRDSSAMRARSTTEQGEAIDKVLGGKLGEADRKKVDEVLASWSKGRGDLLVVGADVGSNHDALFARSSVADGEVLDHGIRSTFELLKVPAISEPLRHWVGDLKLGPIAALEGGARGGTVHGERRAPAVQIDDRPPGAKLQDAKGAAAGKPEAPKGKPEAKTDGKGGDKAGDKKGTESPLTPFDLTWSIDKDQASYVLARDGKAAAAQLASGAPTLQAEPEVKAMVGAVGGEASFILVVLPARVMSGMVPSRAAPQGRPPAGPLMLSFGRGAQGGWLRVDASPFALQQLARMRTVD